MPCQAASAVRVVAYQILRAAVWALRTLHSADYRGDDTRIFVAWMQQREIQVRCSPDFISFHPGYAC